MSTEEERLVKAIDVWHVEEGDILLIKAKDARTLRKIIENDIPQKLRASIKMDIQFILLNSEELDLFVVKHKTSKE